MNALEDLLFNVMTSLQYQLGKILVLVCFFMICMTLKRCVDFFGRVKAFLESKDSGLMSGVVYFQLLSEEEFCSQEECHYL